MYKQYHILPCKAENWKGLYAGMYAPGCLVASQVTDSERISKEREEWKTIKGGNERQSKRGMKDNKRDKRGRSCHRKAMKDKRAHPLSAFTYKSAIVGKLTHHEAQCLRFCGCSSELMGVATLALRRTGARQALPSFTWRDRHYTISCNALVHILSCYVQL